MAKGNTNMKDDQAKQDEAAAKAAERPNVVAKNEFAPNVVGEGPTAQLVEPAPTPPPSMKAEEAEDDPNTVQNEAEGEQSVQEEDFLAYFNEVLVPEARKLGYEVKLSKVADDNPDFTGPTARYQRDTGQMRVFTSKKDVPADYVPYAEYLATKKD